MITVVRMIIYACILSGFVVFGLWAYKAMIDVRPNVERPGPNDKGGEVVTALEGHLQAHVVALAEKIGPRNVFLPAKLHASAQYIRTCWEEQGYEVTVQAFKVNGTSCENLSVEIPGKRKPEKIVVVGAHYDTVSHSPGANDNGSAVASLLELSRLAGEAVWDATVRFVAFTNEEPPFFKTGHMGSLVYAKECKQRKEDIAAMICLETMGYYTQEPKTQKYPFPLNFFYPNTGDFLAVVGNLSSKPLVKSFAAAFMEAGDFPIECAAPFGFITGIDWSDHWSFWQCGYQAIMLTDTALFRYPYYHSPQDTADKLDYHSLARVTYGIFQSLNRLLKAPLF